MIESFWNRLAEHIFYNRRSKGTRAFPVELLTVARRKLLYLHDAAEIRDIRIPRRNRLESLRNNFVTLVFYESPHRIAETLEDCVQAFGEQRAASLVREATKLHETVYRGTLRELKARAASDADFRRGEIVLLVAGALPATTDAEGDGHGGRLDAVLKVLMAELPLKQAARLAALITEARDNEAYKRALYLKDSAA